MHCVFSNFYKYYGVVYILSRSRIRTDESKVHLSQNDEKRKVKRSKGTENGLKQTSSSVNYGGGSVINGRAWLPVELGHWCSLMMGLLTEVAG